MQINKGRINLTSLVHSIGKHKLHPSNSDDGILDPLELLPTEISSEILCVDVDGHQGVILLQHPGVVERLSWGDPNVGVKLETSTHHSLGLSGDVVPERRREIILAFDNHAKERVLIGVIERRESAEDDVENDT